VVYQDGIEANLMQLFAHQENLNWLSIISGIIFKVNIVGIILVLFLRSTKIKLFKIAQKSK